MEWQHWALFAFVGLLTASAQYAIAKALKFAEASMLAPIDYSTFFWVVLLDGIVWNTIPDVYTIMGATIIVLSNFYILWKSKRDDRKPVPVKVEA